MADNTITHFRLTAAQAVKLIRMQPTGTTFAIHARVDCPVGGSSREIQDGAVGTIRLTRKQASDFCQNALRPSVVERGGLLLLSIDEYPLTGRNYRCLWIGL